MSYLVEQPPHCILLRLSLSTGRFVLFRRTHLPTHKSKHKADRLITALFSGRLRYLSLRGAESAAISFGLFSTIKTNFSNSSSTGKSGLLSGYAHPGSASLQAGRGWVWPLISFGLCFFFPVGAWEVIYGRSYMGGHICTAIFAKPYMLILAVPPCRPAGENSENGHFPAFSEC